VISLKPATLKFLGPAIAAALLVACAGEKPPQATSQATPPPKSQAAPLAPAPVGAPALLAGLTPLPSSNQVVASVSSGRVDPFAPLQISASRSAPLSLPPGLIFNGVIRSGGTPEALVQFGAESGTLRVGQRGGRTTDYRTTDYRTTDYRTTDYRTTPLLPAGWSVASIDVQNGRLTLRQGKQAVTAEL
jgi:hypothetical protein